MPRFVRSGPVGTWPFRSRDAWSRTRPGRGPRAGSATLLLSIVVGALAGCSAALPVDPAPHAADPDCAPVMLAMPDAVGGLDRRGTTSQATDAWGSTYPIVARCGIDVPAPTTDPCVTIDTAGFSVDWIVQEGDEAWVATTYGRNPALEVTVPKIRADEAVDDLLAALTPPASLAPATGRSCVGLGDLATPS